MKTDDFRTPRAALTLQDQVELGKRMTTAGDTRARELLILNCIPVVKSVVGSFLKQHYSHYDDMFQDGMLGVLKAIDMYDYSRNTKFTTYAYRFILHEIYSGILMQFPVKISKNDYLNSSLINSTISSYISTFEREPTNEEIAELTSLPIESITYLKGLKQNTTFISLQDYVSHSVSGAFNGDVEVLFEKAANHALYRDVISKAMEALNENEKEIIQKRYLDQNHKATLKELAISQQIHIQSVAKREKKALKKLLMYFEENQILFDDLF